MTSADRAFFRLLGKRIRDRREAKGWNQYDLEEEAETVSRRTIASVETGNPIRIDKLIRIARGLGVDLGELLHGLIEESDAVSALTAAERAARYERRGRGRPRKRR